MVQTRRHPEDAVFATIVGLGGEHLHERSLPFLVRGLECEDVGENDRLTVDVGNAAGDRASRRHCDCCIRHALIRCKRYGESCAVRATLAVFGAHETAAGCGDAILSGREFWKIESPLAVCDRCEERR